MVDLADGASIEVQGSGSNRYTLKNVGGAYSCSCPAWRNAGGALEKRTCKHLKKYRGEDVELARVGAAAGASARPRKPGAPSAAKPDAPPLLLAHTWEVTLDPKGWWMSEKLDGVRAYWDGKQLWSRLGNLFHAPDWFLEKLPETPLDGELFGGRKKFQQTVGLVKRQDKRDHWKELRYVVFDAPALDAPFEERIDFCIAHMKKHEPPYAGAHEHELCGGVEHLKKELARIEALGGEGLMLRKPGSRYEAGRSAALLKVKSFFDAEGKVVGHEPGKGKHEGRLGSLLVEMPDGTRFSVGTGLSDKERDHPPRIGAIVTYRYQELSSAGVPRFPSYVGERDDVLWKEDPAAEPETR
jgi:DNA ligase-1